MRGMNDLMRQAQIMQRKITQLQEELATKTVEATSGGGMVTAVATGARTITEIRIDPSVVDPADVEMLQDLVLAAVNDALKKAEEMNSREMGQLTGGVKIPGMF